MEAVLPGFSAPAFQALMVQCLLVGTGNFDVSSRFIPALSLTPSTLRRFPVRPPENPDNNDEWFNDPADACLRLS